jgi:hypothetical protein
MYEYIVPYLNPIAGLIINMHNCLIYGKSGFWIAIKFNFCVFIFVVGIFIFKHPKKSDRNTIVWERKCSNKVVILIKLLELKIEILVLSQLRFQISLIQIKLGYKLNVERKVSFLE